MLRPTLVALAFSAALFLPRPAAATKLEDLVTNLSPGQWVKVDAVGMNDAFLKTGGAGGNALGFSDSVKWDPATKQLFYIGMDHNEVDGIRFITYRESDNTFEILPQPAFAASSGVNAVHHEYDHTALDPYGRHFWFRFGFNSRTVYQYDIDQQNWTPLADNDELQYEQCCGGIDWFPELGGLVWVNGTEVAGDPEHFGGVFQFTSGAWSRVGQAGVYPMGQYHTFAEYNPVHHVVIFGGGNDPGSHRLYKMDATSTVTPLPNAPISLGVNQAIHTVDPISGEYLIFTTDHQFWTYDVSTDEWKQQDAAGVPFWEPDLRMGAGPISTHGVTVFYSCTVSECGMYLYKHAAGSGIPFDGGVGTGGSTGTGGSSTGGSPSTGGATSGGSGGTPASSGGSGANASSPSGEDDGGGCGCRVAERSSSNAWLVSLAGLLAWRLRRRR